MLGSAMKATNCSKDVHFENLMTLHEADDEHTSHGFAESASCQRHSYTYPDIICKTKQQQQKAEQCSLRHLEVSFNELRAVLLKQLKQHRILDAGHLQDLSSTIA